MGKQQINPDILLVSKKLPMPVIEKERQKYCQIRKLLHTD